MIPHRVGQLQTEHAQVRQLRASGPLLDFAHPTQQTLHGEQVDLGMLLSIGQRKTAITRAEIEFDGLVMAEKLIPIKAQADVGESNGRLGIHKVATAAPNGGDFAKDRFLDLRR